MVRDMFAFDLHGHGPGLLPEGSGLRSSTTPEDTPIGALKGCGFDACVLCAVGDPATFGIGVRNEYRGLKLQLAGLRAQIDACGAALLTARGQLDAADGPLLVLLGVEGLDFMDGDMDIIDELHASGVRLLGLVHYTASELGGICMDLRGDAAGQASSGGLTDFGAAVVGRANELGMIVDVTHANDRTILDAIACSAGPVICSHTGPRAMGATPRYIPDTVLDAIARSGGLVGLWPEKMGKAGPADLAEFVRMAAHIVEICGIDAVGIGTDFNGVPGYTAGYRGPVDIGKIDEAFEMAGFPSGSRRAIMGANARRFVDARLRT